MVSQFKANGSMICENRRARFDYELNAPLDAGIVLSGAEVKSLRHGGSQIAEAYVSLEAGELWLINAHFEPLQQAGQYGKFEPRRPRKLLVTARQRKQFAQEVGREGMTIVPIKLFFNEKGFVKLSIASGKGKRVADKRATEAKRDWDREKSRLLKTNNRGE